MRAVREPAAAVAEAFTAGAAFQACLERRMAVRRRLKALAPPKMTETTCVFHCTCVGTPGLEDLQRRASSRTLAIARRFSPTPAPSNCLLATIVDGRVFGQRSMARWLDSLSCCPTTTAAPNSRLSSSRGMASRHRQALVRALCQLPGARVRRHSRHRQSAPRVVLPSLRIRANARRRALRQADGFARSSNLCGAIAAAGSNKCFAPMCASISCMWCSASTMCSAISRRTSSASSCGRPPAARG